MRPGVPLSDRHRDRAARVDDLLASLQSVGRVHRDRANAIVAQMLLDLADEGGGAAIVAVGVALVLELDLDRRVDLRQLVGEYGVDDDAGHLLDAADVRCRRPSRPSRCCRFRFPFPFSAIN